MNTTSKCLLSSRRIAALAAALLLLGGASRTSLAQNSPVGTWDCLMCGGHQPGVAYLTFTTNLDSSGNYTFYGYAVVAGVPPGSTVSERTPQGDVGRGDTTSTNAAGTTNIFGFVPMNGPWGYDSQGRVIGHFAELINAGSYATNSAEICINITNYNYVITNSSGTVDSLATTNFSDCFSNLPSALQYTWEAVGGGNTTNQYGDQVQVLSPSNLLALFTYVVTNQNGSVDSAGITGYTFAVSDLPFSTNFVTTVISGDGTTNVIINGFGLNNSISVGPQSADLTNAVSFVGKVVPGKRLTLNASTTFGKATYRGVPAVALPNLAGTQWNGVKRQQGVSYVEFFSLKSFAAGNPFIDLSDNITNFPNIYYSTNGVGPGYTFGSIIIVSKQKKAGFATSEYAGTNQTLRATYGGFHNNGKTTTSNSKGVIAPNINITYKAQLP